MALFKLGPMKVQESRSSWDCSISPQLHNTPHPRLYVTGSHYADYDQSFQDLYDYIDNSMEPFKHEMSWVLFPLFIHYYLDLNFKGQSDMAIQFWWKYKKHVIEHVTREQQEMVD